MKIKKLLSWFIAGNVLVSALPVLGIADDEATFAVDKTNYIAGTSGTVTTTAEDAQYISSDTSVLTVEPNGTFTAIKEGIATITATTENITEEIDIKVYPARSVVTSRPAADLQAGTLTTSNTLSAQRNGSMVYANTYSGINLYSKYSISGTTAYDGATLGGSLSSNTKDTDMYYLVVWEIQDGLEEFEFFAQSYNDARDNDDGGELANRYRVAFVDSISATTTSDLRSELITVKNGANTFTDKCTQKEATEIQRDVWHDTSTKIDVFKYSDIPQNAKYVAVLMNAGKLAYYKTGEGGTQNLIEIACLGHTAKIRFGAATFRYSGKMVSGEVTNDRRIALTYNAADINPELNVAVNGKTTSPQITYDENTYTQYIDADLSYYDDIEITSDFGEYTAVIPFDKTAEELTGSISEVVSSSENIGVSESGNTYTLTANSDIEEEIEGLRLNITADGLKQGKSYIITATARGTAVITSENNADVTQLTEVDTPFDISFEVPENYQSGDNIEIIIGFVQGTKQGANAQITLSSDIQEEIAKNIELSSENNRTEITMDNTTLVMEASILNQNNSTGGLEQNFEWTIFADDMQTVIDEKLISAVPVNEGDTSKVEIGFGIYANPGTYYAVAKAENYDGFKKVFEFTIDKVSGEEYVILQLNNENIASLKNNIGEYLEIFELDEALTNNINGEALAMLISERAKTQTITAQNAKSIVSKLAVISLFNVNDNNIPLFDADGNCIFADLLELSTCDGEATLTDIYANLLNSEGQKVVQSAVTGKSFVTENDFYSSLYESILLNAITYPNVLGSEYIGQILTTANAQLVGIDISKYLSLTDKSTANATIARGTYTKETLAIAVAALTEQGGNNGGSISGGIINGGSIGGNLGGGGNAGGGGAGGVSKPQILPDRSQQAYDKFSDVDESHWAYDEIYHLKKLGVVSGVDSENFAPENKVTREQFLKMFIDAFEIKKTAKDISYTDVDNNQWYAQYVQTAVDKGMVNGISDTEFGVGQPITRQDLCVIVMRAMNGIAEEAAFANFTDFETISDYAKDAVVFLNSYGVINGFTDGSFGPQNNCTRAQAAKIICTLINLGGIS